MKLPTARKAAPMGQRFASAELSVAASTDQATVSTTGMTTTATPPRPIQVTVAGKQNQSPSQADHLPGIVGTWKFEVPGMRALRWSHANHPR